MTFDASPQILRVGQRELRLSRYPARNKETLRAWDAADELLLQRVAEQQLPDGPVLVLNDAHGAVCIGLGRTDLMMMSDSYSSSRAVAANLERNGADPSSVRCIGPYDELADRPVAVLFRPTKHLALFEQELRSIAPSLDADTVVIGAQMTRHLHRSTLEVLERVLGPTRTSLAHRKARLIDTMVDPSATPGEWPWPREYRLQPGEHVITSHPGVFSPERLDRGTAMLLAHLPEQRGREQVVDLGCGNGVVGVIAGVDNPDAQLTFVDDSRSAIESARTNARAAFGEQSSARFELGNGLEDWASGGRAEPGSVNLILNNPPFHDDHALGDAIAWQMFSESRTALAADGELWVVGNRHLAYHAKLKRLFGNCDVVASDSKFVLLRAVKHGTTGR